MAAIDRAIKDTAQIAFGCSLGELGDISKHVAGPMVAELFTLSGRTIPMYGPWWLNFSHFRVAPSRCTATARSRMAR